MAWRSRIQSACWKCLKLKHSLLSLLRTKANSSSCSCFFESYPDAEAWLAGTLAIPTGSRPNEETSIRAASLANVTRAWQSTLALLAAGQRQHSEVSEVELDKKNFKKNILPSAFASCTLPLTAKQNEVRVLYYTLQFFVIFLISRLCQSQGTSITHPLIWNFILPHTSCCKDTSCCEAETAQWCVRSKWENYGKLNKNSFNRPLLLAPHHWQQNRMKREF